MARLRASLPAGFGRFDERSCGSYLLSATVARMALGIDPKVDQLRDQLGESAYAEAVGVLQMISHHPKRAGYEYERNGTVSIFMFTEPRVHNAPKPIGHRKSLNC